VIVDGNGNPRREKEGVDEIMDKPRRSIIIWKTGNGVYFV